MDVQASLCHTGPGHIGLVTGFVRGLNRPTSAVTDKQKLCVNFTWLGTNIFQLQIELYSSVLWETGEIPFFIYFVC